MIDWQLLCVLLRKHRPLSRAAVDVHSNERHLNRLARGEVHEPRFNTGVRLLDLAHDVLPRDEFMRVKQ